MYRKLSFETRMVKFDLSATVVLKEGNYYEFRNEYLHLTVNG